MAKRLLALASVTALTGLVAAASASGCAPQSSSKQQSTSTNDPADAGNKSPDDAGSEDRGDAAPTPATSCMLTEPIDATKYPYKKAGVTKGACSDQELADLTKFFSDHANEGFKASDWAKSVSAECAACAFSDGSGATWTPILTKNDELDTVDRGGCVEVVSGSEACGRSYQQVTDCLVDACYTKCRTADEYFACLNDTPAVFTGPCKGAYEQMNQDCGNDLQKYEEACSSDNFTFEGPIKVMCIEGGAPASSG